jgi:hypothetical protein
VRIEGRPVRAPYTKVGIVFQSDLLLDWRTVLGNVLFQFDMRGQSARPFEGRARALTIELPRPRDLDIRESPAFAQYVNRVNRLFQQMGVIGA